MSKTRLYIDESGHHRYVISPDLKERYLGLTGVIIDQDTYIAEVIPRIEGIRSLFQTDPDFKPSLHLEDIMSGKNAFIRLKQPAVQQEFNERLIEMYTNVEYSIITIVIDKARHFTQYTEPEHPYGYGLTCMLERYCKYLNINDSKGDVIAEARGKKEDRTLSDVYKRFYDSGTQYCKTELIQQTLTSGEIKLKTKASLIAGLEMADLLALGSKLDVLHSYGHLTSLTNNFTKVVIETVQPKYFRGFKGMNGNGKKFI